MPPPPRSAPGLNEHTSKSLIQTSILNISNQFICAFAILENDFLAELDACFPILLLKLSLMMILALMPQCISLKCFSISNIFVNKKLEVTEPSRLPRAVSRRRRHRAPPIAHRHRITRTSGYRRNKTLHFIKKQTQCCSRIHS